jgi:hypothetical protein
MWAIAVLKGTISMMTNGGNDVSWITDSVTVKELLKYCTLIPIVWQSCSLFKKARLLWLLKCFTTYSAVFTSSMYHHWEYVGPRRSNVSKPTMRVAAREHAGGRVVTPSPLTPVARVHPARALSRLSLSASSSHRANLARYARDYE